MSLLEGFFFPLFFFLWIFIAGVSLEHASFKRPPSSHLPPHAASSLHDFVGHVMSIQTQGEAWLAGENFVTSQPAFLQSSRLFPRQL